MAFLLSIVPMSVGVDISRTERQGADLAEETILSGWGERESDPSQPLGETATHHRMSSDPAPSDF